MALAVSFRLLATEAWVRPHAIPCEMVVGRVALRRVLLRFSSVSIIPTVPLSCHLHAARIRRRSGHLGRKSHAVSEISGGGGGGGGEERNFFFFLFFREMNNVFFWEVFFLLFFL